MVHRLGSINVHGTEPEVEGQGKNCEEHPSGREGEEMEESSSWQPEALGRIKR